MKDQSDMKLDGLSDNDCTNAEKIVEHVSKYVGRWLCMENLNNYTKCDIHDKAMLYCSCCMMVVCDHCENVHASHVMMTLTEASLSHMDKLASEESRLRTLIAYTTIVLKDLHSYIKQLDVNIKEITNEIVEKSSDFTQDIKVLATKMIEEIQREHIAESRRLKDKVSEFDRYQKSANALVVYCEDVVNSVDDKYKVVMGDVVLASVANMVKSLPICPPEMCFYALSQPAKAKGILSADKSIGQFAKASVPWRIEVKRTGSFQPETANSSRLVTALCPASENGHVWVVWQWSPLIHLVDKEGNVKKTVDVACKVVDICTKFGHIIVSSYEPKCIKIIDPVTYEIIKTINTEQVPRGVCSLSANEIIVCCVENLHHRNGDQSHVMTLTMDTEDKSILPCSDQLIQPWRITVNISGNICVSDRNKGAVLVLDPEGNLRASYSGPESSTRHSFAPHGICCDKFGQILVVDYTNHTVHVLDPLGRFRGFLIMDTELEKKAIYMGTSSPFAITIDNSGDIWVGNKFGYLTVLKYLI